MSMLSILCVMLLLLCSASLGDGHGLKPHKHRALHHHQHHHRHAEALPASSLPTDRLLQLRGGAVSLTLPHVPFPTMKLLLQVRYPHPFDLTPLTPLTASQAALTGLNILCWSIPLYSEKLKASKRLLSLANSFAGGIFLMLSFSHLIPQAITSLATHSSSGHSALYYVLFGFLTMLFVEKVAFATDHHIITDDNPHAAATAKNPFKLNSAIILCIAMSVHSFFEAAALGLSNNRMSAVLTAACIGLHQPAESLALVIAFLKSNMSRRAIAACLMLFSSVALLGSVFGVLVHQMASHTVEALFMAASAGTFIYVGATEIVSEEFEEGCFTVKLQNFLSYLAGMGLMYYITVAVDAMEAAHNLI